MSNAPSPRVKLDQERIETLVQTKKSDVALRMLPTLLKNIDDVECALKAFVSKRSVKGVRGIEELAAKLDLLSSKSQLQGGVNLWFSIISAYGRLGKLSDSSRCFKEARSKGAWSGAESDARLTTLFLHALHSDIKLAFIRARQFLDDGVVFEVSTFNVLLKACMRQGDTRRAKLVLSWMSEARINPDSVTYSSLIKTFSYDNNFDGVLYVIDLMNINGFKPTGAVLSNLLVACGTLCQHDTALMLWRDIKRDWEEDTPMSLYEAMMVSCNESSHGEYSLDLLEEMKANGIEPSVKSYNLALSGCRAQPGRRARPLDLINAISIFSEMRSKGLEVNVFTYGQLFEICAEASQGPIASWLQRCMEVDGIKANVIANTSLMKAMIRSNMVDEAMGIFRKMVWGPARLKPTGATFRTLGKELREMGHLKEALKIYTSMRKAKFAPNNIEFQKLIAAAAEAAFSQGDINLQHDVAELCRVTSLSEIDLHGTSRYEARAAVLCVLGMIGSEYRSTKRDPSPLTIIVGRGGHSNSSAPILPSIVIKMLRDELHVSLPEEGEEGHWEELQPEARKDGRIVIPSHALIKWLQGSK